MCGIFGFSFLDSEGMELVSEGRRALLAYKLAEFNDKRGGHSWGVVRINGTDFKIEKGLGDLSDRPWQMLQAHTLMAHTRFATHGDKTVANAHPFEIGPLVGAHNGVFSNHYELNREYKRDFNVDSMHAFAHIVESRDFEEIEGYGTLEWFERTNPSSIKLCQLRMGDLSVYGLGSAKEPRGVVWSSDENHLKAALKAAGIRKTFEYKIERDRIYLVEHGKLYYTEDFLHLGVPEYYQSWRGTQTWDAKTGKWVDDKSPTKSETTQVIHTPNYTVRRLNKATGEYETVPHEVYEKALIGGKDEDEKAIDEWDQRWDGRMRAEVIRDARRTLEGAALAGNDNAKKMLDDVDNSRLDVDDMIIGASIINAGGDLEDYVANDIPTVKEEVAEIERLVPGATKSFQSTIEELREKWDQEGTPVAQGQEDLALMLRRHGG